MSATCRGCGAPIIWATTSAGKRMPVDPVPTAQGTLVLRLGGRPYVPRMSEYRPPVAHVVARGDDADEQAALLYVPHWATCPNAGDFRGPR